MHDVAVGIVGEQRRRERGAEREVAERVVLDQERAGGADRVEHGRAALGRERRAVRVREQRLQVDEPRAGRAQRVGQQVRPDAALVGRHRHRQRPCARAAVERAEVGRRLEDHRRARRREPAQARGERGLPAGADQHVARGRAPTAAAKCARSPVMPSGGTRSHAPGRRAARASAAPSAAVGCRSAGR